MANPLLTPNMGLTEPGIGFTTSTAWASFLNNNFGILDQHDHSSGNGVQITPAGININTPFPFNGEDLTELNSAIFNGAVVGTPSPLSIYTNGTDFFFKDVNGNPIQLTSGGGPNAGTGNISGLPSTPIGGAGIAWVNASSTFQFLLDAGTVGANIDNGTVIIRYPGSYPSPTGNFVGLRAPAALSSGYNITFPLSPPASTQPVSMDSSGNLSAQPIITSQIANDAITNPLMAADSVDMVNILDGAVTPDKLSAPNFVLSTSCGTFSTTSGSGVVVTNLAVSLTTSGLRPIMLCIVPDGNTNLSTPSLISASNPISAVIPDTTWWYLVDSAVKGSYRLAGTIAAGGQQDLIIPPGALTCILPSLPAGTHTFSLAVKCNTASTGAFCYYSKLYVAEL